MLSPNGVFTWIKFIQPFIGIIPRIHLHLTPSKLVILSIGCFHQQFGCSLANSVAFQTRLIALDDPFVALSHLLDLTRLPVPHYIDIMRNRARRTCHIASARPLCRVRHEACCVQRSFRAHSMLSLVQPFIGIYPQQILHRS